MKIVWPDYKYPVIMDYSGLSESDPCWDYLVSVIIKGGYYLRPVYLDWNLELDPTNEDFNKEFA